MSTLFRDTDNTSELDYIAYSKIYIMYPRFRASQEVLVVKNLPANAGDGKDTGSLGQEDPLEEGMATYSSILARRIPWTEEPGGYR